MKRFALLYVAPGMLIALVAVLPLILGAETLLLRDVLNVHLEMKAAQAETLRDGTVAAVDPYRAGGQPLAGNLNAVPFYPTNVLYLAASPLWALNAHFWIHLLLAPLAFFWMARCWGLSREGSWAGAVCFAFSGYFLSNMSFYNLIGAVTLTPALVAAALKVVDGPAPRRQAPVVGLIWALLVVAGDPILALEAFLIGASAVAAAAFRRRGEGSSWRARNRGVVLVLALAGGTLLAAPQLVEFLRILPLSFRGHQGVGEGLGTVASFDPRQAIEWLFPFFFGRPDMIGLGSFWGQRFFTGYPSFYLSLYPGLAALLLVAVSGRPRGRAAWWAWGAVAAGLFLALGRFNPVVAFLFETPAGKWLRYPIKFWLPLAVGGALLCGLGFERLLAGRGRTWRTALIALAVPAALFGGFRGLSVLFPDVLQSWARSLIPPERPDPFVAGEVERWADSALLSLGVVAALAALLILIRSRPRLGGAALLALHATVQLTLLQPLLTRDSTAPYRTPPPALDLLDPGSRIVHGDYLDLFGKGTLGAGDYPEARTLWLARRAFYELYPATASVWGHRYDLNVSPEGLDSFLAGMAQAAVKHSSDEVRLRLLKAWGVRYLLITRPLAPEAAPLARLVGRLPSFGQVLHVYEVVDPAPEVLFADRVLEAPHLNAAYQRLSSPGFDPLRTVVVPGEPEIPGIPEAGGAGSVRVVYSDGETLEAEIESPGGGVLVTQRSYLPLYRVEVDGEESEPVAVNLYRLGAAVPAGRHTVRVAIDRRPFHRSLAAALAGAFLLLLLAFWRASAPPEPSELGRGADKVGDLP